MAQMTSAQNTSISPSQRHQAHQWTPDPQYNSIAIHLLLLTDHDAPRAGINPERCLRRSGLSSRALTAQNEQSPQQVASGAHPVSGFGYNPRHSGLREAT